MMDESDAKVRCESGYAERFGMSPELSASAPGRIEVLGNHTDYNLGLTLSCAVGQRCYASIATLDEPIVRLSSTADDAEPVAVALDDLSAPDGHWARYALGLIEALNDRGHKLPGFAMLIHSDVPRSAGLSSSSAVEMSALMAIASIMKFDLSPLELAKIGQQVESTVVGAHTGLLDQLSALLGKRDHLLSIDFKTLQTHTHQMPTGWCFVAVDSGVKHDLTQEYNQRRAACERATAAMGAPSLRDADQDRLDKHAAAMDEEAWRCAQHVISENDRVRQAQLALQQDDLQAFGAAMYRSHQSSKKFFRNSCDELDALVALAQHDPRCVGARLSGGGFGGITIHLVREADAHRYLEDVLASVQDASGVTRWGSVCRIDDGARVE